MAGWRKKLMPLAEWAPFQDRFDEIRLATGDHPDSTMFSKGHPADELTEIYLYGPNLELLERFSPGGWEDSGKPSGAGVALLVGAADAWERFGIDRSNS